VDFWNVRLAWAVNRQDPPPVARKLFVPKHSLPVLNDYKTAPPDEFWAAFPSNRQIAGKSAINPKKLRSLALGVGCSDWERLELAISDLENGCDIGCRGTPRNGSVSNNAPSAFQFGQQISDAIADWITEGFAAGPFSKDEVPPDAKISGIMCREKPNGSARIILNLSAPAGRSVNDGICSDEFPTSMSSTAKWVEVLNKAGRGCLFMKADWSVAYKHLHVRPADTVLQWFSWLDKFFVELNLVFGARSSAGLFDRIAKVVLDLAARLARFSPDMICQYLDDVCAASPAGSTEVFRFEQAYRDVAAEVGVKLAPTSDPDKAFSPTTAGVVLGVKYDSVAWTWSLPPDKLNRVLLQLSKAVDADTILQVEMASIAGRILHYAALVPLGKFNIVHILKAVHAVPNKNDLLTVTSNLRGQLYFWLVVLQASDGYASIPRICPFPIWTFEFWTDAGGGSTHTIGQGCGGVAAGFWFMLPWGRVINSGVRSPDGSRYSRKMSALELVGPLVCLAAGADLCRGRPVRIWVDNFGSVAIFKKGYSTTCMLSSALASAIAVVATAIGCRLTIDKITRCSSTGAILADELSKGRFEAFLRKRPEHLKLPTEPATIPPSILAWVARPQADNSLGAKILADLGIPFSPGTCLAATY